MLARLPGGPERGPWIALAVAVAVFAAAAAPWVARWRAEPRIAPTPAPDESDVFGTVIVPLGPRPTSTPRPAPLLWRVTERGCCPLPFWSADGKSVLFWHAPEGGPSGVYGVPVERGAPRYVADRPSAVFARGTFTSTRHSGTTILRRAADGRTWSFDLGPDGWLAVAPSLRHAATVTQVGRFVPGNRPPPVRHGLFDLESGSTRSVAVPDGYGLAGWTADGVWLMTLTTDAPDRASLIRFDPFTAEAVAPPTATPGGSAPDAPPSDAGAVGTPPSVGSSAPITATMAATGTGLVRIADASAALLGRLRSARLSPGGRWIAYVRAFDPDPAQSGIYVVSTRFDSPPRRLDSRLFGGFRWRDGNRLLIVPQAPGHASMALWQVHVEAGFTERLIDPRDEAARPFRIAAGEWAVSPDGHHVAYRHAGDGAIWMMLLP